VRGRAVGRDREQQRERHEHGGHDAAEAGDARRAGEGPARAIMPVRSGQVGRFAAPDSEMMGGLVRAGNRAR
jgi:hypothetical protein